MIAVFSTKSGHVASVMLQERMIVNAERNVNIYHHKVSEAWSACCPNNSTHCLLLHYDNTSAHTTTTTQDYLETNCIQLVIQTPYSPVLAPCDFFLFRQVKQQLKRKQFEGIEDVQVFFEGGEDVGVFFEGVVSDVPQSTWSGSMVT